MQTVDNHWTKTFCLYQILKQCLCLPLEYALMVCLVSVVAPAILTFKTDFFLTYS